MRREAAGEALGAFIFLLIGGGAMLGGAGAAGGLAFGLAHLAAARALRDRAPGQFNPALTVAAALAGRLAPRRALLSILAQLLGSVAAAAILRFVAAGTFEATAGAARLENGYGTGSPGGFGLTAAFAAEFAAGFILAALALRVRDEDGRPDAIALAAAIGGLAVWLAPVTGVGLSPARSTAAALFGGAEAWSQLWLFWVAPVFGAAAAALLGPFFARATEGGAPVPEAVVAPSPSDEPRRRRTGEDSASS
ncbi:MAG: aquaporin [Planctomycetota bacterium]